MPWGAVLHRLLHGQPLGPGVLAGHHHVDIVAALDAVIEAAEQAVCIRAAGTDGQHPPFCWRCDQETRVLMGKAVVVLLPYVGSEDRVERRDRLTPRQPLQTLSHLACCAAIESIMRMNAS